MKTTKKKWWPKAGEEFFYIHCGVAEEIKHYHGSDNFSKKYFSLGVFKTFKEAQTALRKIKKFVKEEL